VDITIIGTGFIGTMLGRALVGAGHHVTFGSRCADGGAGGIDVPGPDVVAVGDAIARSDALILALPGSAVGELAAAPDRRWAAGWSSTPSSSSGSPSPSRKAGVGAWPSASSTTDARTAGEAG